MPAVCSSFIKASISCKSNCEAGVMGLDEKKEKQKDPAFTLNIPGAFE